MQGPSHTNFTSSKNNYDVTLSLSLEEMFKKNPNLTLNALRFEITDICSKFHKIQKDEYQNIDVGMTLAGVIIVPSLKKYLTFHIGDAHIYRTEVGKNQQSTTTHINSNTLHIYENEAEQKASVYVKNFPKNIFSNPKMAERNIFPVTRAIGVYAYEEITPTPSFHAGDINNEMSFAIKSNNDTYIIHDMQTHHINFMFTCYGEKEIANDFIDEFIIYFKSEMENNLFIRIKQPAALTQAPKTQGLFIPTFQALEQDKKKLDRRVTKKNIIPLAANTNTKPYFDDSDLKHKTSEELEELLKNCAAMRRQLLDLHEKVDKTSEGEAYLNIQNSIGSTSLATNMENAVLRHDLPHVLSQNPFLQNDRRQLAHTYTFQDNLYAKYAKEANLPSLSELKDRITDLENELKRRKQNNQSNELTV